MKERHISHASPPKIRETGLLKFLFYDALAANVENALIYTGSTEICFLRSHASTP